MQRSNDSPDRMTDQPLLPRILAALTNPRTLAELSRDLDVTDSRLDWHLRSLTEQALVELDTTERWTRTTTGDHLASHLVIARDGPFGAGVYDLDQAYAEARAGLYGSNFLQRSGHHATRLSDAQASEFANRLQTLVAEYFAPGRGDRSGLKYGLSWAITPVDLHPLDDDES